MSIEWADARKYTRRLRCTIHKTGRLGFSDDMASELGLKEGLDRRIRIGVVREGQWKLALKTADSSDEGAFKVARAGGYYSIDASSLFRSIGIEFTVYQVIYDVTIVEEAAEKYFVLAPRLKKRKRSDEENDLITDE